MYPRFHVGMHQAKAQLKACIMAADAGVEVTPVWNKSNREHTIIGSDPIATRVAAEKAVKDLGWKKPYFCDADHVNFETVDRFLDSCDFFTIDVADFIGQKSNPATINQFVDNHQNLIGEIRLNGASSTILVTQDRFREVAEKFYMAVQHAGLIYRKIAAYRGSGNFITEISMDETDLAQLLMNCSSS